MRVRLSTVDTSDPTSVGKLSRWSFFLFRQSVFVKKLLDQFGAHANKLRSSFDLVLSSSVGVLFVLVMGLMITHYGLNFDEGYNLQVPLNLLQSGVYGSRTLSGFIVLDPFISTGPLPLLAVTASFTAFGIGVLQARLVSAMFAVLILASVYGLSRRLNGRKAGALSLLLVFAVKSVCYRLGIVIGDGAGIGLILAGLVIWNFYEEKRRWPFAIAAGILWGLSVWAKPSMIMAVLFIVVALAVAVVLNTQRFPRGILSLAVAAAVVLGVSWFLISILGARQIESLAFGNAARLLREQFSFSWVRNFGHNLPSLPGTIALGILGGTILNMLTDIRTLRFATTRLMTHALPLAWIVWWMLFNEGSIYRHLFPGLIFGSVSLAQALVTVADDQRARIAKGAIAALLMVGSAPALVDTIGFITHLEEIRAGKRAQEQFAAYVAGLGPGSEVMGWGWFMAWDIAFLSNRTFGDLQTDSVVHPSGSVYLAITPTMMRYPGVYETVAPTIERCSDGLIYDYNSYRLYRLRASCSVGP